MNPENSLETLARNMLSYYKPITLEEMDSVKLMDRMDTKFTFHVGYLPEILKKASEYYRVLEINNNRYFRYNTTYFDTCDFGMYHEHLNGRLNRYKVRQRRYDSTGVEFFEIKFKNNKGRTLKSRIENSHNQQLNENVGKFLQKKTPYNIHELQKVLDNSFFRVTLVDHQQTERATIDFDLSFSTPENNANCPHLGIIEIKQGGKSNPSSLIKIMRELHIRPGGISKYCFGVANLFEQVKTNGIKPKLLQIQNLKYGNNYSY